MVKRVINQKKALSPKIDAFVEAFCAVGEPTFGNATRAALAAGFGTNNRKTASQLGCRMRRQARVQKLIAERLAGAGITGETIRLHMASRFFSPTATNMEVATLGIAIAKLTDGALVAQKHEVGGKDGGPLVVEVIRYADTNQTPESVFPKGVSTPAAEVP